MPLAILVLLVAVVADPPLKITNEPLCPGTISPMQYGQFIEYLCDLVPSMWAEKLYDGSFEAGGFKAENPYKVAYLRQTDFREKPWYPSGATNRAEYSLDSCQSDPRQALTEDRGEERPHRPRSASARTASSSNAARLAGSPATFAAKICRARSPSSCTFGGRSLPSANSRRAIPGSIFALTLFQGQHLPMPRSRSHSGGLARLWLSLASLMPEDTVGGWRPDVVEAIRALKPGVIRFGGSALDDTNLGEFDWRESVGPVEKRKPFRAWGGVQPVAAGLEEIVQFCQTVGAEPLICVRVSGREPQDAADEVEYFNGPSTSGQGAIRARNGHSKPYGIKYWQVGNELAGPPYEARVATFCEAMKKVDPSIKLLSSYPREGVFRKAGQFLDYACPHHYGCGNLEAWPKTLPTSVPCSADRCRAGRSRLP